MRPQPRRLRRAPQLPWRLHEAPSPTPTPWSRGVPALPGEDRIRDSTPGPEPPAPRSEDRCSFGPVERGRLGGSAPTDRPPARGAKVRAQEERRPADAHCAASTLSKSRRAVEERIDFLDTCLERNELRAALHHQGGIESVTLVHLECESAQITEPLFPHLEKRLALSLELARGGHNVLRDGRSTRSDAGSTLDFRHP